MSLRGTGSGTQRPGTMQIVSPGVAPQMISSNVPVTVRTPPLISTTPATSRSPFFIRGPEGFLLHPARRYRLIEHAVLDLTEAGIKDHAVDIEAIISPLAAFDRHTTIPVVADEETGLALQPQADALDVVVDVQTVLQRPH